MPTLTTELATDYLDRAFKYNLLQPDKLAWYPIDFPGLVYSADDTITDEMKAKGTQHLIHVLNDSGCVIKFDGETDLNGSLHHVLWDRWTKNEIGNGRCTGQTVVLGGLASGLANAVFLTAVVTDWVSERCYGHGYRPEDADDEKNLCLVFGDHATRARRDHRGRHSGDEDADRNTG